MKKDQQLAPGYYKVVRSERERRQDYSLTKDQIREMLAPLGSGRVAEVIVQKACQTKTSDRTC